MKEFCSYGRLPSGRRLFCYIWITIFATVLRKENRMSITPEELKSDESSVAIEPFSVWRHFKGSTAVVITVAEHSETGEPLVVYRCTSNTKESNHGNGIYARPLNMFLSDVDREKYPEATQEKRFIRNA